MFGVSGAKSPKKGDVIQGGEINTGEQNLLRGGGDGNVWRGRKFMKEAHGQSLECSGEW